MYYECCSCNGAVLPCTVLYCRYFSQHTFLYPARFKIRRSCRKYCIVQCEYCTKEKNSELASMNQTRYFYTFIQYSCIIPYRTYCTVVALIMHNSATGTVHSTVVMVVQVLRTENTVTNLISDLWLHRNSSKVYGPKNDAGSSLYAVTHAVNVICWFWSRRSSR